MSDALRARLSYPLRRQHFLPSTLRRQDFRPTLSSHILSRRLNVATSLERLSLVSSPSTSDSDRYAAASRRITAGCSARHFSSTSSVAASATKLSYEVQDVSQIRNIAIIAHIDAGKTTCTERILHLTDRPQHSAGSGVGAPGEVDQGSTVTDFLEAERERGITIQSAAVGPIFWTPSTRAKASVDASSSGKTKGKKQDAAPALPVAITLVDTPGHIDFTIEVERSVRVADASVVILDGVEGVEAQTEGVWAQASR
jgi:elongation factor G